MTMDSRKAVKPHKKSSIPGVTIKQLVEEIPKGCSLPDFEQKPITLTLQEGKNATFRAMVKGEPAPQVIWKRNKEEMNNPDKYQMSFSAVTNEFILQINKLTAEDTDVYHCCAVNEYGEAACTAGLKVIRVSFKKNAKRFPTEPQEDLKKELQDFRKMLRKRTPVSVQKKEMDMEQVWQLLLNADRKDYEKICLKYGIVDFRGMLKKLQQMKRDREDKQQQYVYSVTNLKHIKANNEGNATFHLEMDLKNPDSRIYLYKDGQMINYGFNDDNVKHCLRKTGKKYNFTINHLQLEDAGLYQIRVEDVDVFSTQLEADSIPVGFRHSLSEVHCHEQGNAVFECSLYSPCYDATWLYKKHPIEENDKYEISISPDGLTHRLVIKNAQLTEKGTYTLDTRIHSSSAWLEVESAREKRGEAEGDGPDKTGWQTDKSMFPDEEGSKKLLQGESLGHESHLKKTGISKDGQHGSNQDGSRELYGSSTDVDWQCGSLGQDGLTGRVGKDGRIERGQFSRAEPNEGSVANGAGNGGGHVGKIHGQDCKFGEAGMGGAIAEVGLHSFDGKDSMLGRACSGGRSVRAEGSASLDGGDSMLAGAGAGVGEAGELSSLRDTGGTGLGGEGGMGSLHGKNATLGGAGGPDAGVGGTEDAGYLHGKDAMLGEADVGILGVGGMSALGGRGAILGAAGSGADFGGAGGISSLCGKAGIRGGIGGSGAALGGTGEMGFLSSKCSVLGGDGVAMELDAAAMGALGGRDVIVGESDVGRGARGMGSLSGKRGVLCGAGVATGLEDAGGLSALGSRDAFLGASGGAGAGVGSAGGTNSLCGKDGMQGGVSSGSASAGSRLSFYHKVGARGAGLGDARGMGSLYGKDGVTGAGGTVAGGEVAVVGGAGAGLGDTGGMRSLCGEDCMVGGAGAVGVGAGHGFGGAESRGQSLYGKNGTIGGAGSSGLGAGVSGSERTGTIPDKDAVLGGASARLGGAQGLCAALGSARREGGLQGEGGVLGGADSGVGGAGRTGSLYGVLGGADTGVGGAGRTGSLHGVLGGADSGVGGAGRTGSLHGVLGGADSGVGGAGRMGSLYGVLGGADTGVGGAGRTSSLYGVLGGADSGMGGAGRTGSLYGKDPILGGSGVAGSAGAGGMGFLSGEDATLSRAGAGGGMDGAGGRGAIVGRGAMLGGAGSGNAEIGAGTGSLYGKDALVGGLSAPDGKDLMPSAASPGSLYGKDGAGSGPGPSIGAGLNGAGGMASLYSKDIFGGSGASPGGDGAGWLDSIHSKGSVLGGAGPGTGCEITGAGTLGSLDGVHSLLDGAVVSGGHGGLGHFGSLYGRVLAPGGAAVGAGEKLHDGSIDGRMAGVHGEGSRGSDQMSGHDGGAQAEGRRGQISDLDARGPSTEEHLKNRDRKRRGSFLQDEARESHCHFDRGLPDDSTQKEKPAVLPCSLSNNQVEGIGSKDEFKQTGLDEISSEKDGLVHKRIIDTVEDSHARKYKFETEGFKTEASLSVEDPPNVDKALLEKLMKEPMVVKAGQNAMVKIPFKGQKPVRATWLKDGDELLDDTRIHIETADNFTRLSISSANRKDCGDYNVKLKNESGTLKASLKLVVIDKPKKPIGPIEVVTSSIRGITIRWKPPKDDGGKPVQNYIIERKQVGRKTWVTLGESTGVNTTFTTDKVEHDRSYHFRVRAVNAEGNSEVLESDEVMAANKAFPRPPAPPKIVSADKDSITLSWAAPPKREKSRILGYIVEKRKKGSNVWIPITDLPIKDRKLRVTDLKEGLQYEFRVAAISAAGAGEASAPSDAVFARDPMKPPGRVRDLKVTNTDYTSITLTWTKPSSEEDCPAKGYEVEKRSLDSLKWTRCNSVPIGMTTYTVKGLQAREMYFLRVRAINEGGLGEAVALDMCVQAVPPTVNPRFLRDDTMKNFMIIKVGSCIRVHVPFEASPTPEVIWLKDGLPLPSRAIVSTRHGLSQVLIPSAEFSDSGLYTVMLQNDWGRKDSFSFQVKVTDIPQPPGPIWLQEKVLNTVTVFWEPSPTEKQESNLYYVVMKCDYSKSSWQVMGDLIYTNKFTITKLIPGRGYYFRVVAKNSMGTSNPSETVQPWIIPKEKGEFKVRLPKYRGVNKNMPPKFLVQLKPHVVTTAFDCHMSCAVSGYPKPKITWYKDGRNLSEDPTFFTTNDFGVCCLVIPDVTKGDEGEFQVEASNELGRAVSKAMLLIKDPSF